MPQIWFDPAVRDLPEKLALSDSLMPLLPLPFLADLLLMPFLSMPLALPSSPAPVVQQERHLVFLLPCPQPQEEGVLDPPLPVAYGLPRRFQKIPNFDRAVTHEKVWLNAGAFHHQAADPPQRGTQRAVARHAVPPHSHFEPTLRKTRVLSFLSSLNTGPNLHVFFNVKCLSGSERQYGMQRTFLSRAVYTQSFKIFLNATVFCAAGTSANALRKT